MTQDIVTIRRQVKMVSSSLRQGKLVSAVQTVSAALKLLLTSQLMKAEKDELTGLVREAIDYLNNDNAALKLLPQPLVYPSGGEKTLLDDLNKLSEALRDEAVTEFEEKAKIMAARKAAALVKGQEHLDNENAAGARTVFGTVSKQFPEDGKLRGDIGEKFLNAGYYQDAAEYYLEAVDIEPGNLHNYNRLAIALRKQGMFEMAEENYMRALPLAPEDPNLLFNIGRLYIEWEKWRKAVEFGQKALQMHPDFTEAQKLVNYARKRMMS